MSTKHRKTECNVCGDPIQQDDLELQKKIHFELMEQIDNSKDLGDNLGFRRTGPFGCMGYLTFGPDDNPEYSYHLSGHTAETIRELGESILDLADGVEELTTDPDFLKFCEENGEHDSDRVVH